MFLDWQAGCEDLFKHSIEKTVCTTFEAAITVSCGLSSDTRGRSMNSAAITWSDPVVGDATERVTAADCDVPELLDDREGHSPFQWPLRPHNLQWLSRILCCKLFLPQLDRPLALPLPNLDFPFPIGKKPLARNFSLSFLRASTYDVYAVESSSSDCSNSLAAAS